MTFDALKPCPFCGGAGEIQNTHTASFWVECQECGAVAHGDHFDGPQRDIKFAYSSKPKGQFEASFSNLYPEYRMAFLSAVDKWNRRVSQ